jgi:hypothetical protein
MNKRTSLLAAVVLGIILFLVPVGVLAFYSDISGELRDQKTQALWVHGGTVRVYDCLTGYTISDPLTKTVDSSGEFTIGLTDTIESYVYMCVEVVFKAGTHPSDTIQTVLKSFPNTSDHEGTLNAGAFYKDTGPNAVSFTNVTAHSPNVWLPVGIVAGVSMLAMGALIVIRKRR